MLFWSILFFCISVFAGIMGFGGMAAASAGTAQVLFYIFIGLFIVSLLAHVVRKPDNMVDS